MNNANIQRIAQQFGGGAGHFVEDLHRIADRVGVPVGQITERLGRMFALSPDAVMANLDGLLEVLGIISAPGVTASIWVPGALGEWQGGLQSGNYTLSDGSTGYSAVDGTAGLVLDAAGSVGAELVTNGGFGDATGWTVPPGWGVASGVATAAATSSSLLQTGAPLSAGKTYMVSFDWTHVSGTLYVRVGGGTATTFTSSGSKSVVLKTVTADGVEFYGGAVSGTLDNVSVREVTGIHATQATTANKPALRRGLYNLLTYSNDLSNAAWVAENTGSKSGNNILTPAVGDDVYHGTTVAAGSYTLAAQLSGTGTCSLFAYNATNGIHGVTQLTLSSTPTIFAANITSTVANTFYYIGRRTGDTATSITFGAAGLFAGTLTAQQILAEGGIPLTTSTAASNPSAGRYWLGFNGTTNSLALSSIPFQMSDDFAVIAGVQVNSAALLQGIVLPSASANDYVGAITTGGSAGVLQFGCRNDAHTYFTTNIGTFSVGEVFVASGVNRSGSVKGRKNAGAWSSTVTPTGVFTMTLGQFGALGPFNNFGGNLGPVILIKGTVSDADLLTLERWVASQTPAAPTF